MSNHKPCVSIGLPVFNGEKYLEEALDSILAQTYTDFELIISDNASTDRTQQICRAYATKDSRIRYCRNGKNLGASKNFNRVFELASGEYFKWAAHDDVLAPKFLQKCVSVLNQDPSIVLCHSKTGRIDEHGANGGTYDFESAPINSQKPHERFGYLIRERPPTWLLLSGVIQASVLTRTSLFGNYIGSDRNLLAEIGLIDQIYVIPEYLFFRRAHPQTYTESVDSSYQERLAWWTTTKRVNFPFFRKYIEYFKSVRRIPMKWSERQLCYAQVCRWFIREGLFLICTNVGLNLINLTSLGRKFLHARARAIK